MTTLALKLSLDASPLKAALSELSAALAELPDLPFEIVDQLMGAVEAGVEIRAVGLDGAAAARTHELNFLAQPNDRLGRLVAAARAGNLDLALVENSGDMDE